MKVGETVGDLFSNVRFLLVRKGNRSVDHGVQSSPFAIFEEESVRVNSFERNQVFMRTDKMVASSFLSKGFHGVLRFAVRVLQNCKTIFHKTNKIS